MALPDKDHIVGQLIDKIVLPLSDEVSNGIYKIIKENEATKNLELSTIRFEVIAYALFSIGWVVRQNREGVNEEFYNTTAALVAHAASRLPQTFGSSTTDLLCDRVTQYSHALEYILHTSQKGKESSAHVNYFMACCFSGRIKVSFNDIQPRASDMEALDQMVGLTPKGKELIEYLRRNPSVPTYPMDGMLSMSIMKELHSLTQSIRELLEKYEF